MGIAEDKIETFAAALRVAYQEPNYQVEVIDSWQEKRLNLGPLTRTFAIDQGATRWLITVAHPFFVDPEVDPSLINETAQATARSLMESNPEGAHIGLDGRGNPLDLDL